MPTMMERRVNQWRETVNDIFVEEKCCVGLMAACLKQITPLFLHDKDSYFTNNPTLRK